jgi:hypothetical protein
LALQIANVIDASLLSEQHCKGKPLTCNNFDYDLLGCAC